MPTVVTPGHRPVKRVRPGAKPEATACLESVGVRAMEDPALVGLRLTDAQGREFSCALSAQAIGGIVETLLAQSAQPEFNAANAALAEPRVVSHAEGTGFELLRGRTPTECAVRMHMGPVALVVFVPLADLLRAMGEMAGAMADALPSS